MGPGKYKGFGGPSRGEELDDDFDAEMGGSSLPLPFDGDGNSPRMEAVRMEENIVREDELRWAVAKAFFDHRDLAADHIISYNNFVETGIHEMFKEAEPFEVEADPSDTERSSRKKVVIWFGEVELNCKPEVEKEDRVIVPIKSNEEKHPSESNGADKAGGTGKGMEFDDGKVSWLTNTEATEANGEEDCEIIKQNDWEGEDAAGKGKGNPFSKYNLNILSSRDGDPSNGWHKDTFPDKVDMMDVLEDAPSKSGEQEEMQVEYSTRSKAGTTDFVDLSESSTPSMSPRKASNIAGETDFWEEVDKAPSTGSAAKAHGRNASNGSERPGKAGGKSVGYNGDPGPSGASFNKSKRKPNLKLLPVEARQRGITYSSPIYVKVIMETFAVGSTSQKKSSKSSSSASSSRKEETQVKRVLLGRIPVMVKSSLCHLHDSQGSSQELKGDCCLDPGGYFIIKGSEKVIVAQEERSLQRLWVSCIQGAWTAICTPRRKGFSYYNYQRTIVKLSIPKKTAANNGSLWPLLTVILPGVEPLPMGILFSALGVSSDREILEMICYDLNDAELLQTVSPSLLESDHALAGAFKEWDANTFATGRSKRDKEVAMFYIGSKTTGRILQEELAGQNVLKMRVLPHVGTNERTKALFLGYMVRTVCLCYLGRQKGTDRDDFKNKRLEFAGEVISHQFRKLMGQVINTMKKRIQKHLTKGQNLQDVDKYLDDKVITRGLKVAFSSGNWKGHDAMKNSGIVFDLKRGNPMSTLCQLREFRQFVPPTVRVGDEARHPTFSQWGRVCPIDTPDGESCGLVKNMALTGIVSCTTPEGLVLKLMADSTIEELESVMDLSSLQDTIKVFLNGRWIGTIESRESDGLVDRLREARRSGGKDGSPDLTQVEIVADKKSGEVHISTDGGRVLRPLLIVKDQGLLLSEDNFRELPDKDPKNFEKLLQDGVVELLGIEEEEKAMIALHGEDIWKAKEIQAGGLSAPTFTHAEIHPSLILGLSASVIPFPNRNQSSRNLFQAHKHSKQAIGFYVTNISSRTDTSGQHLFYPQTQLVKTNTFECLDKKEIFSGQNAIVAIACYTGYNQEDSIIMDQSSLDRGMFRTTHYRTFRSEEKPDHETLGKPVESDAGPRLSRSIEKLDDDGLPGVGLNLSVGDVIIGKVSRVPSNDVTNKLTDGSQRLKAHEKGRVDQVVLVQDDDGSKVAKVKLRETRMPQVGDKFSSMHGQKGILGMVFTQEDLPFTMEGIVPDIIINPHAFPTRQTLGQMCESALGKVVAKTGQKTFATPFNPACTVESISEALHESGYEGWGTETLYNGFTGQAMEAKIFIGSTFYQRLTHMVEDKIKYRSRGHVHPLTRQPVADRKRHGGVKFGEMERDCLIAHGAAATLQERSFILSDFHTVHLCTICEQLANWNSNRIPECCHCPKDKKKGSAIVKVELPYACKLLMQELMSMGISVRLKTERL